MFLETGDNKIARMLVELDFKGGLVEILEVCWGKHFLKQEMDYQGIPLKCNRCHFHGHLIPDFKLPFQILAWSVKKNNICKEKETPIKIK